MERTFVLCSEEKCQSVNGGMQGYHFTFDQKIIDMRV
jgi:hypothetical protein